MIVKTDCETDGSSAAPPSPLPSPPPGVPDHLAGAPSPQLLGPPPLRAAGHLGWLRPRVDQTAVVLLRLSTRHKI